MTEVREVDLGPSFAENWRLWLELIFYAKYVWKRFGEFKQRCNMTWNIFYRRHSGCWVEDELWGVKSRSRVKIYKAFQNSEKTYWLLRSVHVTLLCKWGRPQSTTENSPHPRSFPTNGCAASTAASQASHNHRCSTGDVEKLSDPDTILETEMTGLIDSLVPEGKRIKADFKDLRLEQSGQRHHLLEEGRLGEAWVGKI